MVYHFKLEKIMKLKEREKDEAQSVYNDSVKKFEEAAEKLYQTLKKKEDLEIYQSSKLEQGLPVQEIRHHQSFIVNLQKTIDHYQKIVMNARNQMLFYQEKLMNKNIEVKKYEILKEKDKLVYLEEMKQMEAKQMDDISIQQYMHRGS
ncbi:flagellar export protein FliJ [Niallia sp. Krafla_26]|uniref:flagellar export protein FliJ n=1 Tax=Niallia sp. Krafla_26 TaxID=3064703 RepID=UPI003D17D115